MNLMKPLKYAFVFLFLCRFLTASGAAATEIYTLQAILVGVSADGELTVRLVIEGETDDEEVNVAVAENCRFIETKWDLGIHTALITFADFIERFTDQLIEFDFVEDEENDFVDLIIECRNMLILEN